MAEQEKYTHKVVAIHEDDAHIYRKDLIGKHCKPISNMELSSADKTYLAGTVEIENERSGGNRCFYAVKLEKL